MKKLILSLLIAASSTALFAQTYAAQFLDVNPDARSLSVANSAVVMDASSFSVWNNAAASVFSDKSFSAAASYGMWQPSAADAQIMSAAGFGKIGEKVVHHQARKYGVTKFGLNRFVNGYLDLISLWFLSKFGVKPMHIFGFLGSLMFILGFLAVVGVGAHKIWAMNTGQPYILVTESPYFYLALTTMILGTQLFLAGFLGELIARNSAERNNYQIEKEL